MRIKSAISITHSIITHGRGGLGEPVGPMDLLPPDAVLDPVIEVELREEVPEDEEVISPSFVASVLSWEVPLLWNELWPTLPSSWQLN